MTSLRVLLILSFALYENDSPSIASLAICDAVFITCLPSVFITGEAFFLTIGIIQLKNFLKTSPHYVWLLRKKINSIRMFMRDNQGNPIKFKDGDSKVIYKLHLRPKKL